jgi:hypothetical protein
MLGPDELSLFAQRLEEIGAPYMITGATAAILYGQPRVTNDLDVVLSLGRSGPSARRQATALPAHGAYRRAGDSR